MANALSRIIEYPNRPVFDKDPQAVLALRVRNPLGLVWTVADGQLTMQTGGIIDYDGQYEWDGHYDFGITRRTYSLANKTIAQLADELAADGHQVIYENPDIGGRSAGVLIAGAGNPESSNGDHLMAYTSLLWSLYGAYAVELDEADYQVKQALRQMVFTQAEGEWLDVWATLYGVPRLTGETDAELQQRLPEEVFRIRVNGLGIEEAVKALTGQTVAIEEPWRRMHILDESALSGIDHLQDGQFYTYHVIQPVGAEGTDWTGVLDVIRRNKAAGIEIYESRVETPPRHIVVQPPVEYGIERGQLDSRGSSIWSTNNQILGVMRLSDNEFTLNHPCSRLDNSISSETGGFQTAQQIEPHRSIAMAAIALSDGPAAGEENFVLGRGAERVVFDPEPIPSDMMFLSGYDAVTAVERVELITISLHALEVETTFLPAGEVQRIDTRAYASDEAYLLHLWTGGWDAARWVPEWRISGMVMTSVSA